MKACKGRLFKRNTIRIMIEFKKYSSIENSFYKDYVNDVREQVSSDVKWVVQEKVHGTNTSFLCDGHDVKFAKRTSILAEDENFYDYHEIIEQYHDKVLSLFRRLCQTHEGVKSISIFGELFGGAYPHPDVQRVGRLTVIQKGVFYTPKHEFYGFDIYVFTENGGSYLSVDETNALFKSEGFFYAKSLFLGTLDECLQHSNQFQSKIPEWLGLPAIADNICEGIVIRPVVPQYLRTGSRALIKSKNEKFAEKKSVKRRNKQLEQSIEYSKELKELLFLIEPYVNENRLVNVVSHIGEVKIPRDFGRLVKAMYDDVMEDFLKEHRDAHESVDKSEQRVFNSNLNKKIISSIKAMYMAAQ